MSGCFALNSRDGQPEFFLWGENTTRLAHYNFVRKIGARRSEWYTNGQTVQMMIQM